MTIEGATDSDVFRAYVQEVLCPTLNEGDIVIADNLAAHKAAGVQEAIQPKERSCGIYHRTRPTSTRSSRAGQRSRRFCVPPRHARAQRLMKPSHGRWRPSRRQMPGRGSLIVVMFYTKLKPL